ncbi:hypothetical protein D3C87_833930 [compost metagenome]
MVLSLVTYLMLMGIIRYYPLRDDIGFLQFKKEYLDILPWKIAFYTHVFTIIFALLAGFTQFSASILAKYKRLHRLVGKIYVYDVFLNFPVAFVMGIYANGLLPTKIAFMLLDCLWFWFTYRAVTEIRKGNVLAHKEFMIRSYALTLSAVSLRFWKIVILSFMHVDPLPLYMINAWLGFVPNLLFAEWLIRKRRQQLALKAHIVQY